MRRRCRLVGVVALVCAAIVPATVAAGPSGGALPPVLINVHQIAGVYGIPDDAEMVALTITGIRPAERGWIKVYPCDQDEPETANLTYETDAVTNNLVISRIADDGTICVATLATTDYVIDVAGYTPAGSDVTPLLTPLRALDTRNTTPTPLPDQHTTTLQLGGTLIPTTAKLAIFTLTAISTNDAGYVTAYPCDEQPATTASLNFAPNRATANLVITRLSATGTVCFRNKNNVNLVVDLAGYATNAIATLPAPRRILDTRNQPGPLPPGTITIPITRQPGIADNATTAIYNLASVAATAPGFATAYPCNQPQPPTSTLNYPTTQAASTAAITKLDPTGNLCITTLTPTELVIDLIGTTTTTTNYTPITPTRIHDTRQGWQRTCDWIVMPKSGGVLAGPEYVVVVNIATGARKTLPLPPEHLYTPFQSRHPIINETCDGVLHYGNDTLFRIGFNGKTVAAAVPFDKVPEDVPGLNPEGSLRVLQDGTVVHVYERVIDLATAEDLGPGAPFKIRVGGPDFGQDYYQNDVSIARDGSIIAATYVDERESFVEVLRRDGSQLTRFDLEVEPRRIHVSPDGTYIVVSTYPRGELSGASLVYTVYGDLVDLVYGFALGVASFTGAGELVACVAAVGILTWQLFGSITLEIPFDDPLFTEDNPRCTNMGT